MSNVTEILAETGVPALRDDAAEVAFRVGVSTSFVRKVINGTRKGTRTSDRVMLAYQMLLTERAAAKRKFQPEVEGE
ncbi:hypothetical protein IC235_17740 [Hymenobacter sp. BT664]|uniref:Uncharacterized protein n=1 Tax=Hymenobacter montanus TaxID=2771359 RepID=A0A927GL24_9BACT|nr:hypothetical protein [Hymenobacter montanus]MBD2769736.1 hypothetical protein [Hymenobacter montanus]